MYRGFFGGLGKLAGLALAALVGVTVALPARAADAVATADVPSVSKSYWDEQVEYTSPFSACNMNCAVHVFGGPWVLSSMTSIFLHGRMPWNWDLGDSVIVGGDFSREIIRYGDYWAFETEIGMAKRIGGQDELESWAALYWRWKAFPWNEYVRTSLAISTGVNYASDISKHERFKSPDHQAKLLHYLAPELTLGPPDNPNLDFVFRFHHRSGGELALFDKTGGGSQYMTFGVRYHW